MKQKGVVRSCKQCRAVHKPSDMLKTKQYKKKNCQCYTLIYSTVGDVNVIKTIHCMVQ